MKLLFHDGYEDIDTESDPDLGFHGVVTGSVESFDAQVLFDPAEEELDLPALGIERGDGCGRKIERIGEKNKGAVVGSVVKFDATQFGGIILGCGRATWAHDLIAAHTRGEVNRAGIKTGELQSPLGADDKEGSCLCDEIETSEIEISSIHDVEGTRLENELVEPVDLVNIARRHMDRGGDGSPQIELGVDSDRRLGGAKMRPRKHAQAEIDSGRIKGVHRLVQLHAESIASIETPGFADEMFGQIGVHLSAKADAHWRGPRCSATPNRESPCGKAGRSANAGKLRCLASSPGRSTGRRPDREIDPSRRSDAFCSHYGVAQRSGQMSPGESTP